MSIASIAAEIASNITRLQTAKNDLETAIEGKGVTVPAGTTLDGFAALVDDIQTGGGTEPEPLDVDFIDYDGTLLYTYTAEEFLALTEMPPNPSHEGLIAQGWNWTLADAKEYVEDCGFHVIGQNYTTDDGKTRIYIEISENDSLSPMYIIISKSATSGNAEFSIDWGDGTVEVKSFRGGSLTSSHTYNTRGSYVIKVYDISKPDQQEVFFGYYGTNQGIVWNNNANANDAARRVTEIEIGEGFDGFGNQPFQCLANLRKVSVPITCVASTANPAFSNEQNSLRGFVLPNGTTKIGNNSRSNGAFYISLPKTITSIGNNQYYRSVKKLVIPDGVTAFSSTYMFRDLYSISRLRLPNGVTSYPDYFCHNVGFGLQEITVPEAVTSIGRDFMNGSRLSKIRLKPTTPPTLSNSNSFPNLSSMAKFYVPYSADHSILEAYQTATNWSTFASKMVEEDPS